MQQTPIALIAQQVCLLKFPLPNLLTHLDHTLSQGRQIHTSWWFFVCSQLRYFSTHSPIPFTQMKWS